jgi:hypothetical protein
MSLIDIIERWSSRTTRHVVQMMRARNASRRADEKEVASEVKLLQFDNDLRRVDETLHRLRDQGALLD